MNNKLLDLTFIVPFRNEDKYMAITLDSLAKQEIGDFTAEVILINGMSVDDSVQVVKEFLRRMSGSKIKFSLIDNPGIKTPIAFNIGITCSDAPIIGFGGAHTSYPPDYFKTALELLDTTDAGVVGGGHDKIITLKTDVISQGISCLYLSPMGAGVADYHRRKSPGYVDTVYGGFYRRIVFDRIGLFDETLERNQDNELNARVLQKGYKIYYHPGLSTTYIQKTDLGSFLRRAYSFGFYHPPTWMVNPGAFRLRHFIPTAWVIYLVCLIFAIFINFPHLFWVGLPLYIYVMLLGFTSIGFIIKRSLPVGLVVFPLFASYHVLYGIGILIGSLHMIRKLI